MYATIYYTTFFHNMLYLRHNKFASNQLILIKMQIFLDQNQAKKKFIF